MKYQVVILAGGESSRFYPFNNLHKSFFVIGGKTIIERTIEDVLRLSPSKIIVVLGKDKFAEESRILSKNSKFNGIEFVSQEHSNGQMDAILSAKDRLTEDFFVLNAQQFNLSKISDEFINRHTSGDNLLTVGSSTTDQTSKYGILKIDGDKVTEVIEKPEIGKEPSNRMLIGIYLFSRGILDVFSENKIWENALEEVINNIAKQGKVTFVDMPKGSPTLKYPWDLFDIKNRIFSDFAWNISSTAEIDKTAILKGDNIFIGDGAKICEYSIIEGPSYIGDKALVGAYSQVRGGSIMEKESQIERYVDLKNSIISEGTHIHSGFIGDSVIGKNSRIGAGFTTANKRLDRKTIGVTVKSVKIDTAMNNLGAFIGDDAKIGIGVSTMPGTIVGNNVSVYPGNMIKGFSKNGEIIK